MTDFSGVVTIGLHSENEVLGKNVIILWLNSQIANWKYGLMQGIN